jgi:hypothetical protein
LVLSSESSTKQNVRISGVPVARSKGRSSKNIEGAIFGYIRAIRALGHKEVNTIEIAQALSLPVSEVNRAILSLKKKGVRAMHG